MWYGVSSIAARFLYYLLTPYLTARLSVEKYGDMSIIYSAIPFLNVVFTYGIETAYFRFATRDKNKKSIYNTAIISILCSTVFFTAILIFSRSYFAHLLKLDKYPEYVALFTIIIAVDTICTIPFAKLRLDQRPRN